MCILWDVKLKRKPPPKTIENVFKNSPTLLKGQINSSKLNCHISKLVEQREVFKSTV